MCGQIAAPRPLLKIGGQARARQQCLFQRLDRVCLRKHAEVGDQYAGVARRRVESLCCQMQACQGSTGCERMLVAVKRGPRQRIAIQIVPGADALHFVDPIALRQRGAALGIVQHLDHRRAGPAQMRHEDVFLAQRSDRAHAAVVTLDDQRTGCGVHACSGGKGARAVPADHLATGMAGHALQHAMDLVGGQHRPVRQRQFQAHAMHLMLGAHGHTLGKRALTGSVSGIDQKSGADAPDPARTPATTRTALPGRRCIAHAIRRSRRME